MDDSSFFSVCLFVFVFFFLCLCCFFVFFGFALMQHTKLGAEIRASLIIFAGMVSNEHRSIFPF